MSERTLVLIKPDGVARGLVGEIVGRIEAKGFTLEALELRTIGRDIAAEHYAEHAGKVFFEELVAFITGGPLVAAVISGRGVVGGWRAMMGETDPASSPMGTIRGDLATTLGENVVHGSDTPESAEREIALFFPHLAV